MWIFSQCSRSGKRGFTLIELLVVISIMLILTSVFLLRQSRFNSSTLLRSLAYSVGLSVRQAQVYGTSLRESASGAFDAGTAAKAYGLYFSGAVGNQNSYTLFADSPTAGNAGQYDSGEEVQVFKINPGYSISKFCSTTTLGVAQCWIASDPGNSVLTYLTILFKRPNPDSCFATNLNTSVCQTGATPAYVSSYVQLKSGNDTRSVTVTITGQISVGAQGS